MTAIPAVWALFSLLIVLFGVCVLIGAAIATFWFVAYMMLRFIIKPLYWAVTGKGYDKY